MRKGRIKALKSRQSCRINFSIRGSVKQEFKRPRVSRRPGKAGALTSLDSCPPLPYAASANQSLRGPVLRGSARGSGSGGDSGTSHLLAVAAAAAPREVATAPGEPLAGVYAECRHFKARFLKSLDISKLKPAPPTELQGWDVLPGSSGRCGV